jgi:hypothetical protein
MWPRLRHHVRMPGFAGITVEAAEGPRWDLALELISSGDALVRFGGVEIW